MYTYHGLNYTINHHSIIPSFIQSFHHSLYHSIIPSFIQSFHHSFNHSIIHYIIPSFIISFHHSIIPSFNISFHHSLCNSIIHYIIPSFNHSIIHSIIPSFILSFHHTSTLQHVVHAIVFLGIPSPSLLSIYTACTIRALATMGNTLQAFLHYWHISASRQTRH